MQHRARLLLACVVVTSVTRAAFGQEYPSVVAASWFAFFVPAKTPPAAIEWLNRQANEVFSQPSVRDQFQMQGFTLPLGSPKLLGEHTDDETKQWGEVIRKAGIKLPN